MRAAALLGAALLALPFGVAVADPRQEPPARALLPDLASLPPDRFTFEAPDGHPGGCTAREAEQGARRCLRFSTYLANVGEGPLDLALAPGARESGAQLAQRVHAADGSWAERPAGLVEWHGVHGHYHVGGLVSFELRALGGDGGAASNATAAGGKTGFCLFDAFPGPDPPTGRHYRRWNCKALRQPGVGMGLSPGWVDRYNWTLADQYLEVSGVPDGLYRLTVLADPGRAILEAGLGNNAASVTLRLAGDRVEALTESP